MKILIITDAWINQTNGVVTTLINTKKCLEEMGHNVEVISPNQFNVKELPTYKEIKIATNPWKIGKMIKDINPDAIHIATEGPLGLFAGMYLRKKKYKFTTSYHTKMPEYVNERFKFIPKSLVYMYMRFIHKGSSTILVTTESMLQELQKHGFKQNIMVWNRGVDATIFNTENLSSDEPYEYYKMLKPYVLYVGRISIEKNLEAFINLDIPYNKVIVGDGPLFDELFNDLNSVKMVPSGNVDKPKYATIMVGKQIGEELKRWYAHAEVFVFPSKTDTYGIVMLESMACGTPVAAYPVTGPIDCVKNNVTGYLDDDLASAIEKCTKLDRSKIAKIGQANTWESCTQTFLKTLVNK